MARIGSAIIVLLKPDGQDWRVHRRYSRSDMPETLQVGITVYTDWANVNSIDPLVHNQTVNTEGQPDLIAHLNFFRYSRPAVPASLAGLDLLNPAEVSDTDLLAFLGFESIPNNPNNQPRINHEGRILNDTPSLTQPILFNTEEADSIISSLQLFPRTSAWNEDISKRTIRENSNAMIAQVKSDLSASRQTLRPFYEMNYILVPENQAAEPINFTLYGDESDPSPYPIAANTPIEGWPRQTGGLTLQQWQEDTNGDGGDRHSIILQPATNALWETWQMKRENNNWEASNGARFNIGNNLPRPAGWTSADAGGLSMMAGLVRYDECKRGMVEHAIRLIVRTSRREYLYPASHFASSSTEENRPAMGQRFRLKENFQIPESWTLYEKAVCRALKKYGAIVADNGGFFSISVSPDDRFPDEAFDNLRDIDVDQFEVIETTQAEQGPRSAGVLAVDAGNDQAIGTGSIIVLQGKILDPANAAELLWYLYKGPQAVAIDDATQLAASVRLTTLGKYTFMLRATDAVHSPAFDTLSVIVTGDDPSTSLPKVPLRIDLGKNHLPTLEYVRENPLRFTYRLESSPDLQEWNPVDNAGKVELLPEGRARVRTKDTGGLGDEYLFYRVRAATGS